MAQKLLRDRVLGGEQVLGSMLFVAAGRKHKKGRGFMTADAALARQYKKLAFNMLGAGTDPALLIAGIKNILAGVAD